MCQISYYLLYIMGFQTYLETGGIICYHYRKLGFDTVIISCYNIDVSLIGNMCNFQFGQLFAIKSHKVSFIYIQVLRCYLKMSYNDWFWYRFNIIDKEQQICQKNLTELNEHLIVIKDSYNIKKLRYNNPPGVL